MTQHMQTMNDLFTGKRVLEVGDTVRYLRWSMDAERHYQGVSVVKELLDECPPVLLENGERLFFNEVNIVKPAREEGVYIKPQADAVPHKKHRLLDIFRF